MWRHELSSLPHWVSFSNAPSRISLNSLSYSCLQYDMSFFSHHLLFKSSAELLTDSKMYVHELQTTLKCSQQPKTVWGQESVVDSFCCYTILPQPSVPLLVLYLSSCLKSLYLLRPPGVWGGRREAAEGSVAILPPARPSGTPGPLGLGCVHSLGKAAKVS